VDTTVVQSQPKTTSATVASHSTTTVALALPPTGASGWIIALGWIAIAGIIIGVTLHLATRIDESKQDL
jgi:hypothetical protein